MEISIIGRILWAAGFVELAALLLVLVVRKRWKIFPTFSFWIAYQITRTIFLYFAFRTHLYNVYFYSYWISYSLDIVVQTAIVFELAKMVLRPSGSWTRGVRKLFLRTICYAFVLAAIAASLVNLSLPTDIGKWLERCCLFGTMLAAQLFLATFVTARKLGLIWRHHVMGIATGWTIWSIPSIFAEAAYSHFGTTWHGVVLDQIQIVAYQIATIYWAINLWLPEPESRTLSPEMLAYLARLQEQARLEVQSISSIDKN